MTHVLVSILGLWLLFVILRSMTRIALMNRHYRDFFAEVTARAVHTVIALRLRGNRDTTATHLVLLWIFPAYLLSLITVYFLGTLAAFALLYWGTHAVNTWRQAIIASGSALNTLGFATPPTFAGQLLAIPEGGLGLGVVVFLFTFIPSYQAVVRLREDRTAWLYRRAGDQPTGVKLLEWCHRTGHAGTMGDVWEKWEDWFRMLADTHSLLPMLTMAPSVQIRQSWVLAAAAVLDAAALAASSIETGDAEAAKICVYTGTHAFVSIADALGRASSTTEQEKASLSNEKYEAMRARLSSAGMSLRPEADPDTQRLEFLSLRGQYEEALFFVARRTFTPSLGDMVER